MKKENDDLLIVDQDQELRIVIEPNDILTTNMESILFGGGPGDLPGGGNPTGPTGDCPCKKGCLLSVNT